jgi:hypothetical protein
MPSQSNKARIEVLTLAATISAASESSCSYVGQDRRGRGYSRSKLLSQPLAQRGTSGVRSGTGTQLCEATEAGCNHLREINTEISEPVQKCRAAGNQAIADGTACAPGTGAANAH